MQLIDALRIPSLSQSRVVAGHKNLGNDISWVHVIDHPDIESWTRAGQLLLTTGYHWPKSGKEAADIVRTLHARQLSGVVLAVPKFLKNFPEPSVETAEELGFPLIEVHWAVPFSDITFSIHCGILDQYAQVVSRAQEIHSALTRAALDGNGLQDLAGTVGTLLERTVYFCDIEGRELGWHQFRGKAGSPAEPESTDYEKAMRPGADMIRNLEISGLNSILSAGRAVTLPGNAGGELEGSVVCPITVRGRAVGIAWVFKSKTGSPLGDLDFRAIEHASTVAALMLTHQKEISAQEARLGYTFVDSLLEGRFEPTPTSLERATLLHWSPDQRYRVCLILLNEPVPLSREGLLHREQWAERLKTFLQNAKLPKLISASLNQIHCLLPEDFSPDAMWSAIGSKSAALAVSRPQSGVKGIAKAAHDVQGLIPFLKPGKTHSFDEILFPRALEGDREAQHEFIEGIFGKLSSGRRSETSIDTLIALAEKGFQLIPTARELDIHISTLRYRLERLQEALGLSIDDPETRFRLQVAVRLYKIREGL